MKFALLFMGLVLTGTAWANIGSVTELSGAATIKRGKDTITVAKGTVIEQNDRVETKNGKLKIVFKDDTTVSVTEHSALVIDDFVYDPKSGAGKLGLKAASGTVRYVSGAIAKDPKNVKINTPTAAITVRGTDFVMSVGETGASMVILMPTCDWESSAVKGVTCGSGKIDVESGPNLVSMDRPYQATLVETAGLPPTPPITVNLFGTPIGNNLQIAPPRTLGGASVIAAARSAAAATGVIREGKKDHDKDDKDDAKDNEKQHVASRQNEDRQKTSRGGSSEEPSEKTQIVIDSSKLDIEVGDTSKENPNVRKIWKDKSETQQIGWQYESLTPNGNNYANIVLPMETKALVIVTQDRVTDAFNFNTQSSKSYGLIVINQTYR